MGGVKPAYTLKFHDGDPVSCQGCHELIKEGSLRFGKPTRSLRCVNCAVEVAQYAVECLRPSSRTYIRSLVPPPVSQLFFSYLKAVVTREDTEDPLRKQLNTICGPVRHRLASARAAAVAVVYCFRGTGIRKFVPKEITGIIARFIYGSRLDPCWDACLPVGQGTKRRKR